MKRAYTLDDIFNYCRSSKSISHENIIRGMTVKFGICIETADKYYAAWVRQSMKGG